MRIYRSLYAPLILIFLISIWACDPAAQLDTQDQPDDNNEQIDDQDDPNGNDKTDPLSTTIALSSLNLTEIKFAPLSSCEELNGILRDQAIIALTKYWEESNPCLAVPIFVDLPPGAPRDDLDSAPVPEAGAGADQKTSDPSFTPPNTQIEGVGEPDDVFTDGHIITVNRYGLIDIYKAWPPEDYQLLATISGNTDRYSFFFQKMIMIGTVLFVFGQAYDNYGEPDPKPLPEPLPTEDIAAPERYGKYYAAILKYDLTDPARPVATLARLVESASWSDARYKTGQLISIFSSYFYVPVNYWPAWEDYRDVEICDYEKGEITEEFAKILEEHIEKEKANIATWDVREYLPTVTTVNPETGDVLASHEISCTDILGNSYIDGTQLTMVLNENTVKETEDIQIIALLSYSSHIFMNSDTLLLESQVNKEKYEIQDDNYGTNITASVIHKFDLHTEIENGIKYAASGVVPGNVPSQWSLFVKNGIVWAATQVFETNPKPREDRTLPPPIDVTLNALEAKDGFLDIVGQLKGIVENEEIFSTRFVGDMVYLVTYEILRNSDPLFVIDIADATKPEILGTLEMPGFSSYLQMIDDQTLLGLGHADATCWFNHCQSSDFKGDLYDVQDASLPSLLDQFVVATQAQDAQINHLNVHYEGGHLYLPFVPAFDVVEGPEYRYEFQVNVYRIADDSFTLIKELPVDPAIVGNVLRTILIENYLYVIGYNGIQIFDANEWLEF